MEEQGSLEEFQSLLGTRFENTRLLEKALTHSSAKTTESPCNERLEFLGDSVIGLVVAENLFKRLPHYDEGDLTLIKSVVVSSRVLAKIGRELGFERFIRVGKGIKRRNGLPPSLVAGVVEAVVGAVFIDRGMCEAEKMVMACLSHQIESVLNNRHRRNFKSILQNFAQKRFGVTPSYRVVSERGPAHGKIFEIEAVLGKRRFPSASGSNKKEAEQNAAERAMDLLAREDSGLLPAVSNGASFPIPWCGFRIPDEEDAVVPVDDSRSLEVSSEKIA